MSGFVTIGLSDKPNPEKRIIGLIDMDSFFASCEEVCNPSLKSVPLIICGRHTRGVVTTANRMAKVNYGIAVGMSGGEAHRRCPDGVFMVGDLDKYIDFSRRINKLLRCFTPLIEPYSIDEMFLDLTGCPGASDLHQLGLKIKEHLSSHLGLPSTIGFGPNRFVAKMACKLGKPDGIFVLSKDSYRDNYWPRKTSTLWGIGSRGEKNLKRLGIDTVADLAHYPRHVLESKFGVRGAWYHAMAWGEDDSTVGIYNEEPNVSYGHSFTLERDSRDPAVCRAILFRLCDKCASRMRRDGVKGRTVHIGFETEYGVWHGHQVTLSQSTHSDVTIFKTCWREFLSYNLDEPVRRFAIRVSNLEMPESEQQMMLFDEAPPYENADSPPVLKSVDVIRERYGDSAIMRGSNLVDFRTLKAIHFQTARRFQSSD